MQPRKLMAPENNNLHLTTATKFDYETCPNNIYSARSFFTIDHQMSNLFVDIFTINFSNTNKQLIPDVFIWKTVWNDIAFKFWSKLLIHENIFHCKTYMLFNGLFNIQARIMYKSVLKNILICFTKLICKIISLP